MAYHRKTLNKGDLIHITEVMPGDNDTAWIAQSMDGDPQAITERISRNLQNYTKLSREPTIGDAIIAKFDEDGYYYRAQVQRTSQNGHYSIIFVDFGNEAELANWREAYHVPPDLARTETSCLFWRDPGLSGLSNETILDAINDCVDSTYFKPLEQAAGAFTDCPVQGELIIIDGFGDKKRVSDLLNETMSIPGKSGFPDSTCLNSPSDSLDCSTEPQRRYELIDYADCTECYLGCDVDHDNQLIWLEVANNDERRSDYHDQIQPWGQMATSRNFYEGDLVLAIYDGGWDRGLLLNVNDETNEATVLFVDFGNTETVSLDEIRHHQKVHVEPMFAMPIKIPGAINAHLEQLEQLIQRALEEDVNFQFTVLVDNIEISDDHKWPMQVVKSANIRLVDKMTGNGIGLAEYLGVQAASFTERPSQSLKIPFGTLPPKGRFHCELIEKNEGIDGLFYILPNETSDQRRALCDALQEIDQYKFEGAQVGDACLAVYDNYLYRAVVIDCDEHAEYLINFIDYGNMEKTKEIFQISPEHAAVPRFAIPISFTRPLNINEQAELFNLVCDETRVISAEVCSTSCAHDGVWSVMLFIDDQPLFDYLAFEETRFEQPDAPARQDLLLALESPLDDIELDKLAAPTRNSTQLNEAMHVDNTSNKTESTVTTEQKHSVNSNQSVNGFKREIKAPSMRISTSDSLSSSIIDINTTQFDDYTHIIVTKVKCTSRVTVSFMELSKWLDLQELIDRAMEQIQPVGNTPQNNSECIVRDKGYDKADTGFRRARVIDVSKSPRVSVELIDTNKKVSFKISRIYPSPSIISSLEKTSMTAAIAPNAAANLQLKEGGKYRAVLDHSGRDIVIRQIYENVTVDAVSETLSQFQVHCTKHALSRLSFNELNKMNKTIRKGVYLTIHAYTVLYSIGLLGYKHD